MRVERLLAEYGCFDRQALQASADKIERRLGGALAKEVSTAISEGRLAEAIGHVLTYYDSSYDYGLSKRPSENTRKIEIDGLSANQICEAIVETQIPNLATNWSGFADP